MIRNRDITCLEWEVGYFDGQGAGPERYVHASVPGAAQHDIAIADAYPDFRLDGNYRMFDWMEDSGFRGNLFSAGASFTIDFERLFWLRFPFSVGITYSYSGGTAFDTLLSAVRADGAGFGHHYVGPVFSVDF